MSFTLSFFMSYSDTLSFSAPTMDRLNTQCINKLLRQGTTLSKSLRSYNARESL